MLTSTLKKVMLTVCLTAALGMAACTTSHVDTVAMKPASERYQTVVVGKFTSVNQAWDHHVPYIREGMLKKLRESGEFATVMDSAETPLPASAVVVNGTLTEVDEGSTALRFIIGFGAGGEKVGGRFTIVAPDNTVLADFNHSEYYSGGAGIGGIDMLTIDQLMGRMGEKVEDAVIRWNHGESLNPPTN
jgi:hypothetical protein